MSGWIGSQYVDVFNGFMLPGKSRTRTETYERPGVDGIGVLVLPKKPTSVLIPTLADFATEGEADTALAAYDALIGTTILVSDQFNDDYANTLIEECVPIKYQVLTGFRVQATWRMLPE